MSGLSAKLLCVFTNRTLSPVARSNSGWPTFPIEAFESTLDKAAGLFREHGIRFHLTGGITIVAYGEPRMTQALDVVVDHAAVSSQAEGFLKSATELDFLLDSRTL